MACLNWTEFLTSGTAERWAKILLVSFILMLLSLNEDDDRIYLANIGYQRHWKIRKKTTYKVNTIYNMY